LTIANRNVSRAQALADTMSRGVQAKTYGALEGTQFDVVINATSSGLNDQLPPLPEGVFAKGALAYDMMYGRETPFMKQAKEQGAQVADGLGMLVEQAAEAFYLWRGVRPQTTPVIAQLRNS
jgi:shikimate dehydrogenase